MDQVELFFNQIVPEEINQTAFSIKLCFSIVFGVSLFVLLFFMARRDSVTTESRGSFRFVLGVILALAGISSFVLAIVSSNKRDYDLSVNPRYELFPLRGWHYIVRIDGAKSFNITLGDDFLEYVDKMSPYYPDLSNSELSRKLETPFMIAKCKDRFGDAISERTLGEIQYMNRNAIVQDLINLRFKDDPRYEAISTLADLQKLNVVNNDKWLSKSEIDGVNKKVYTIDFINNSICLVIALGCFLIAWAVYCLRYRPSQITKKKRVMKIAGYCCLSIAYLFSANFFDVANEIGFKQIIINVVLFIVMLVMFVSLMRLCRSSSDDTSIMI